MSLIISTGLASVFAKIIIMSNQLTAEQQRKIEENRRKALERRAQRLGQTLSGNKQTSTGFNSTTVQVQPLKQSTNSGPATVAHYAETPGTAFAPIRSVPTFKTDSQSIYDQNQDPKHRHLSGTGNQINQSSLSNSASSAQVRIVLQFS